MSSPRVTPQATVESTSGTSRSTLTRRTDRRFTSFPGRVRTSTTVPGTACAVEEIFGAWRIGRRLFAYQKTYAQGPLVRGVGVPLTRSVGLRAALEIAEASAQTWATVFDKERVLRRAVDLGFDPADHSNADYDAVADYMAPLETEASRARLTPSGLRWCYRGEAVLFEMTRMLNAPYDDLVERVDIASAIRMMSDYIGGASAVVSRDTQGRVLRQAERNVYLPQPNWLAFSGGDVIDVCKLEVLRYEEDWRRIAWRTIHSPNGSATHDDGTVTYQRPGPRPDDS